MLYNNIHTGTEIRLIKMEDPYSPVPPGTRGTVAYIDDAGQIHMKWENGRTLALVPGVDEFVVTKSITIIPEGTTRNPITKIGEMAGICWGADTSDPEKNYQRGLDCINAKHGRTLEYVTVNMILDGYSARVIREWYTHIGGAPTRLQASTRYINYENFSFVTPPKIKNNPEALTIYEETMKTISKNCQLLEDMGIPREDSAMQLPLGMTTKIVDHRNLRNLIDMSGNRLCTRAYWEFRELLTNIMEALKDYSDEWRLIIETQFKPKCEVLGYCPEKKSCGRKSKKQEPRKVLVDWDIDDDDRDEGDEGLPPEIVEIPDRVKDEDIEDYLSDLTGFCHKGFKIIF